MKNVAVVLSGCGFMDGAEIYESVVTLLALDSNEAEYQCFAPDNDQMHVINHLTGQAEESEKRNTLVEAARIARGNIKPVTEINPDDFDAIIFPGGFGAAKNLSNFATEGTNMTIDENVLKAAKAFAEANKPAGYICIAPALAASVYGAGVKCTIGNDQDTANALNTMGATHVDCEVDDIVIDEDHKLVTTPAYMLANRISEAAAGIEKLVRAVLEL